MNPATTIDVTQNWLRQSTLPMTVYTDARRSCHGSDYALWFDLLLLRSCCITMAADDPSPALAAPFVRRTVELPALAAQKAHHGFVSLWQMR